MTDPHRNNVTSWSRREFFTAAGFLGLPAYISLPGLSTAEMAENTVHMETDVLVVGGGSAGLPAALAAFRQGVRVVVAEEDPQIGGAPVDMFVAMPCGFPRFGIYRELLDILETTYNIDGTPVRKEDETKDHWYFPQLYLTAWRKLLGSHKKLRIVTGARCIGVLTEDAGTRNRVTGAVFDAGRGQRLSIRASVVIDASGSGEVSELAGAACRYGRESREEFEEPFAEESPDTTVMPYTWMMISQRFRPGPAPDFELFKSRAFIDSGVGWYGLNQDDVRGRNTGAYLHWGPTVRCADTRNSIELGKAASQALEKLGAEIETWHRNGFNLWLAPRLGVRECRRVEGEYIINMNDLKAGRIPDDTIALGAYYLDAWGHKLTEDQRRVDPYGIPYRAVIPRGMGGLLTAGKCISGTHLAMSSYRVQCHVAQIGQAAGIAAAMAVKHQTRVRDIDIAALQQALIAGGIPIDRWRKGDIDVRWRPEPSSCKD